MKQQIVTMLMGFAALASFAQSPNVIAWGSGVCTNVPSDMTNIVAVSAGYDHVLALRADGTLTGWGDNTQGQLNIPDDVQGVTVGFAAGNGYGAAIRGTWDDLGGEVEVWGNQDGRYWFGINSVSCNGVGEVRITDIWSEGLLAGNNQCAYWGLTPVTSYMGSTTDGSRSMALFTDGTIANWGGDANQFPSEYSGTASAIAMGDETNIALMSDQSVWMWNPTNGVGTHLTNDSYSQVSAYGTYILGLKTNGTVTVLSGSPDLPTLPSASKVVAGNGYGLIIVSP